MIEDVVIPFFISLIHDARLFQQVSPHGGADDIIGIVEADFDVFAEARGIVIARRFRVPDRLHDRI